MPIETPHPSRLALAPLWRKCRDCYDGEEAVKAAGETYLPRLQTTQAEDRYLAYVGRALFYEVLARTVQGLTGAAVVRPPSVQPEEAAGLVGRELVKEAVRELLLTGRAGLLVDRPRDGGDPYIALYRAEQIVNWRLDQAGRLVLVVLREEAWEPDAKDRYVLTKVIRFRELALEEGRYTVRLWAKPDKPEGAKGYVVAETITPARNGQDLAAIPFAAVTPEGVAWEPKRPPVLGLANANLWHYRVHADYSHGLHWTALPTPWASGVQPSGDPDKPISIGSGEMLLLGETGKAGYLEYTGTGLEEVREALAMAERLMAALGARLLESQRKQVETAETTRLRQAGENSVLASTVLSLAEGLTQCLRLAAAWDNASEAEQAKCKVELATDFVSERLTAQELTALVQALQSGSISMDTFVHNLRRGGIMPEGRTTDEEQALIAQGGIMGPGKGGE